MKEINVVGFVKCKKCNHYPTIFSQEANKNQPSHVALCMCEYGDELYANTKEELITKFNERNSETKKQKFKPNCSDCSLFVGGCCSSPNGCYYLKED